MGILSWIVFGLIAGASTKWIMPRQLPGGIVVAIMVGISGAIIGGFIASLAGLGTVTEFNLWSLLAAIGGALAHVFGCSRHYTATAVLIIWGFVFGAIVGPLLAPIPLGWLWFGLWGALSVGAASVVVRRHTGKRQV